MSLGQVLFPELNYPADMRWTVRFGEKGRFWEVFGQNETFQALLDLPHDEVAVEGNRVSSLFKGGSGEPFYSFFISCELKKFTERRVDQEQTRQIVGHLKRALCSLELSFEETEIANLLERVLRSRVDSDCIGLFDVFELQSVLKLDFWILHDGKSFFKVVVGLKELGDLVMELVVLHLLNVTSHGVIIILSNMTDGRVKGGRNLIASYLVRSVNEQKNALGRQVAQDLARFLEERIVHLFIFDYIVQFVLRRDVEEAAFEPNARNDRLLDLCIDRKGLVYAFIAHFFLVA